MEDAVSCRKKSTAPFPPCLRRPQNHLRHRARCVKPGLPQANRTPARLLLYRQCGISLGISATLGRAAFTGHPCWACRWETPLRKSIPDPLPEPRDFIAGRAFPCAPGTKRPVRSARSRPRPAAVFLLGVLGVAASNYLYYLAIQRTNVATAIILQYTAPVWVLLYTVARGAQRHPSADRSRRTGVIGCALAVGFVGSGGFRMDAVGVTAALLAAFSFAFYNVADTASSPATTAGKSYSGVSGDGTFWIFVNPPWKIVAAHYNASSGNSCWPSRSSPCSAHFPVTSRPPAPGATRA